jgi:membrane protease YdiL (CAAX protease family)
MNFSAVDLYAVIVFLLLAVVMPVQGIQEFRRLGRWLTEGKPDARQKAYRVIMIIEWGLVAVLLTGWFALGRDAGSLRLVAGFSGWQWAAVTAGLAATIFMIVQARTVRGNPDQLADLRRQSGKLINLAPHTPGERRDFDLLSITAGICEEILYRGVLLAVLISVSGTWPAVVVSSFVFGMGHLYQGGTGLLKTSFVGLAMALLVVFSGSLLPAMILHIVVDITSGRLLGAAVTAKPVETDSPNPQSSAV